MRTYLHFVNGCVLSGLFLSAYSAPAYAVENTAQMSISYLEEQLFNNGESPQLFLALAIAYANIGDFLSSQAYLDLIDSMPDKSGLLSDVQRDSMLQLRAHLLNRKSGGDAHKLLFRLESGATSNANRGTDLNSLSLSLNNGETFYLELDPEGLARSSAFVNSTFEHHYLPVGKEWLISTALETTHFEAAQVEAQWLVRSSLRWQNHSVTAYHFEHNEPISGLFYAGQYAPLDWGARLQSDRNIGNLGASHQWITGSVLHRVSTSFSKDWANKPRAGGEIESAKVQYQLAQNNWQLGYFSEWGRSSEVYNAVFFPGEKDHYRWQSLTGEWVFFRNTTGRLSLKFQYDTKVHAIDLNSWDNKSLSLSWSQKIF